MESVVMHEGQERKVEGLVGRRKSKKEYEYEVKWVGLRASKNTWFTR